VFRRVAAIVLLALLLTTGQAGALLHGLVHTVHDGEVLADQGSDANGEHSGGEPCNAFDGLLGGAACGSHAMPLVPPQVPTASAQFYFRHPTVLVVYSTRAPPAFHL